MADLTNVGEGMQRAAETVLRGTGGRAVMVRVPQPGQAGAVTEQLGLAAAVFADVEVSPCVVRPMNSLAKNAGARYELLIAAKAAAANAGGTDPETVLAWFRAAAGVVIDEELLRIASVSYREVAGVAYVYRLEIVGAATAVI